jgi:hypothetical protein
VSFNRKVLLYWKVFSQVFLFSDYLFEITEPLFNQESKVGASTSLECKINTDCPNVKVVWYRDDTLLDNGDDFHQTFDGSLARLVIADTQPNDSGMYRCVVKSGEMMELESGARLTVIEEGKICWDEITILNVRRHACHQIPMGI